MKEKSMIKKIQCDSGGEQSSSNTGPFIGDVEFAEHMAESNYGSIVEEDAYPNPIAIAFFLCYTWKGMVYIEKEDRLYRRTAESGLYQRVSDQLISAEILDYMVHFVRKKGITGISHKFTYDLAKKIIKHLKGFCLDNDFFKRKPEEIIIHTQNCFLVWSPEDEDFMVYPLDTEWIHSRNQLAVSYDPQAKADRFMNELLGPVLETDEIEVLLMYAAQFLIGVNLAERILLITGDAGSGKSVTANVFEGVIGKTNVTQLRTECLHGHFETNRYIGKNMLCGKDAPAHFLQNRGASVLKSLTGKDTINTEAKHSNSIGEIVGNFNVVITSNCSQPITVNEDREAWARRMLLVHFRRKGMIDPIVDFDEILIREEGSGIFNELLKHLKKLLINKGHIEVSRRQKEAVENLLDESESVKVFLQDCVEAITPPANCSLRKCPNLSTEELYLRYQDYARSRGWQLLTVRKFQQKLVELMAQMFQRFRRMDIKRDETNHRGYYAVRFKDNK